MKLMNENPSERDLAIFSAFMEWTNCYNQKDIDGVAVCFDPNVFSVGTGLGEINIGSDGLIRGFKKDFNEVSDLSFVDGEVYVKGWDNWGWLLFNAVYEITVKSEKLMYRSRRTVVYRRDGESWLQVHVHHSIPDKEQSEARSYPVGPEAATRYALLFSSFRDGIVMASSEDRRILEVNEAATAIYGLSESRMIGSRLDDLMSAKDLKILLDKVKLFPKNGVTFQSVHTGPEGALPVDVTIKSTVLEDRSILLMVVRDISERLETEKALRRSEERLRMAIEVNDDCLWELHIPTMTVELEGATDLVGPSKSIQQSYWMNRIHPDDRSRVEQALSEHLSSDIEFRIEYRLKLDHGRWLWVLDRGKLVERDGQGKPIRMLGTLMDIDRRKRIEEERFSLTKRLEKIASIDGLTGILNRQRFEELVQLKMEKGVKALPLCLIMFDLDRFKEINDSQGHQAGDKALIDVCDSVSRRLRRDDLFCRWGGDEFMVALEQDLDKSALVAEDLRVVIEELFSVGLLSITASFGISPWDGYMSLDDLAFQADDALYKAKKKGRNQVVIFGSHDYY